MPEAPSALHLLHRAGQCADELFASQVQESELTPRQFVVLMAVPDSEEPSQTTLVQKTGIDRSTLADIVRRLVERGLLARKRTRKDARMYAVRLTSKGETALKAAQRLRAPPTSDCLPRSRSASARCSSAPCPRSSR